MIAAPARSAAANIAASVTSSRVAPARLAASVDIEAVRTLRRECYRDRNQLAMPFGWRRLRAPQSFLLHEGREFRCRQLLEFSQAFQIVRMVIVHYSCCGL